MNQRVRRLALCSRRGLLAALGICAVLYLGSVGFRLVWSGRHAAVFIERGSVMFLRCDDERLMREVFDDGWSVWTIRPAIVLWPERWKDNSSWLGGCMPEVMWNMDFPLWPPLLLLTGVTALAWRLAWSAPPGHCRRCRYDLRGLAPAAPCPECGAASSPSRSTPA